MDRGADMDRDRGGMGTDTDREDTGTDLWGTDRAGSSGAASSSRRVLGFVPAALRRGCVRTYHNCKAAS